MMWERHLHTSHLIEICRPAFASGRPVSSLRVTRLLFHALYQPDVCRTLTKGDQEDTAGQNPTG